MNKKILFSLIFFSFSGVLFNVSAQESTNTAGGEATGDGGSASFSIGLVDYLVSDGGDNLNCRYSSSDWHSASQGVQQPFNDERINNSINEANYSVFPNPATYLLTIDAKNEDFYGVSYELTDASGRLIFKSIIKEQITQIKVMELSEGFYLLRLLQNNLEIKNHKVLITK